MIDLKNPGKIGSGITERSRLSVGLTGALIPTTFDAKIVAVEHRAVGVLADHLKVPPGVTDDKLWDHVHDGARRLARKILRGGTEHHPFDSPAWYAARILVGADTVRRLICEGKAGEAATEALTLGAFVEEAHAKSLFERPVLAHRRSRAGAAKGGSKPKRNPAVLSYVRARLRKNPKETVASIWRSIGKGEENAVCVGKAMLCRELGSIVVIEKRLTVVSEEFGVQRKGMLPTRVDEVSRRSFRDYVGASRKERTR